MTPRLAGLLLAIVGLLAGCSTTRVSISIPHNWKPVTYGGLTIDVPPSWPVYQRPKAFCGIPGPGVLVEPAPPREFIYNCPEVPSRGVVLTFGGPDRVVPAGPETLRTIHGVEVAVSKANIGDGTINGAPSWTSEEVARFPGHNVWLRAYAPGNGRQGCSTWLTRW
jgi:hypothetical protein